MSVIFKSKIKTITRAALLAGVATLLVACGDDSETATDETGNQVQEQSASSNAENAGTETSNTENSGTETSNANTPKVDVPNADGDVDMDEVLKPGPLKDMAKGDANAPVTIVEYMSMTCPHCKSFHENTFGEIEKKYIDSGKVRFIVREFPFDPRAAAASMLARCAPEDQFFPMIDLLFQQQGNWARAEDARDALLKLTKLAGFTQESFNACLTNQQLLDDVTAIRKRGSDDFGIQSTPSFIVNGKRYSGDMSVDKMSALIDSLL